MQFANFHLVDKVEWDLCSPMPPELFAETLCLDLGLSGEAKAAIAHVIHEELIRHKKEAIESGLMGASTGQLSDLDHPLFNGKGPRKLESVWREWHEADEYIPRLNYYAAADIEKRELEREKSTRWVCRLAFCAANRNTAGACAETYRNRVQGLGRDADMVANTIYIQTKVICV